MRNCDNDCYHENCQKNSCLPVILTVIVAVVLALLVLCFTCVGAGGNNSTATPNFVGLAASRQTQNLKNSQQPIPFNKFTAQDGKNASVGAMPVSSITLAANHIYLINYNINAFVNDGKLGTLTGGLLIDNVQQGPSISTNTSNSLVSIAGSMTLEVGASNETLALYTIATGEMNLLNAQLSVLQVK